MSGFLTNFNTPDISPFLSFFAAHFAGRQSATAAVEIKAVKFRKWSDGRMLRCSDDKSPQHEVRSDFLTAASISLALTTSTLFTPFGVFSVTGPAMSVTSCPRLAASAAIANPIFPVEGFDKNLTGSRYSLVGPAVTTILISPL